MSDYDYSIYYKRFHKETEAHAKKMANWISTVIEPHIPEDRNTQVLDIGCGFGFALRAMRDLGFVNLKGVEISAEQAEQARLAGFDVEVTDDTIAWLEKNESKFSYVILLDVLEHVPVNQQITLLKAIYNSLKPGGKILLTVPNANAILFGRWRYNDYTHHSSFTEHSLHFVLSNAGFQNLWFDTSKGFTRPSWRIWKKNTWASWRRIFVRWCWLQVFKAELPWEKISQISFELNLTSVGTKNK
jgi:2-polyprenyl-3-methyl-5-hydroxy-6-metoxy-1,4-benzoquinol methylase